MHIGIIGTGTISTALVRGIAGDGHQITVSERSAENAAMLAREFDNVSVLPNQQVLDNSEVVILGLMADVAPDILGKLRFRGDQRVISLMAGASLDRVADLIAPATATAIMLPPPAIATGGAAIMLQGDAGLAQILFGARNHIFALPDSAQLDAYLCAQGVLSPVARMVGDAAKWLGARVDDPAQGEAFLRALVASSLQSGDCETLIQALNTPGGYNQRLRQHMETNGMGDVLIRGLDDLESGA